MSCFESLTKTIDKEVTSLLKNISSKYNIDEKEILEMWTNKVAITSQTTNTPEENTLLKLSKTELIEMCKGKGLKIAGSKNDLAHRISESEKNKSVLFQSKDKNSAPNKIASVVSKLVEKIPVIEIKKNKFGNYEHLESSLVYDNKTQKMYGKQNPDGSISKLTKDDINTCNKFKFSYTIPDNLVEDYEDDEDDDAELDSKEEDVEEEEEEEEEEEDEEEEEEDEDEEEEIEIEDFYD
jgi:hypothetical protein